MNNLLRVANCRIYESVFRMSYRFSSASGKAGSIKEAGGAFAKKEAAHEEEYFHRQQKEQIQKLKDNITDEIKFHEEQIKRHKEAIERNKKKVEDALKEN